MQPLNRSATPDQGHLSENFEHRAGPLSTAFLAAMLGFASAASAGNAVRIAERGGFMLGQAYRCGSPVEHLENSATLIQSHTFRSAGVFTLPIFLPR